MKRTLIIMSLALFTFTLPMITADAGYGSSRSSRAQIEFESQRTHNNVTLEKTGQGIRKAIFGVKVYSIAHYAVKGAIPTNPTPSQVATADVPKEIVMVFMRSVKDKKIKDSYDKSLNENNPSSELKKHHAAIQKFLESMNVSMKKGDKFELLFFPKKGLQVTTPKGTTLLESPELGKLVWNVWFGPKPPSPGVKLQNKLLMNVTTTNK